MSIIFVSSQSKSLKTVSLSSGQEFKATWDTNVDARLGRGSSDTDITYIALRNANGTIVYLYPNSSGNGLNVSTTIP
jgi:hypothetical protein